MSPRDTGEGKLPLKRLSKEVKARSSLENRIMMRGKDSLFRVEIEFLNK